ncbi:hypothetical protein [Microbulbifer sp. THAF38]|uniref:hypothetical protein n=1 Tax=Microbulbifer sp. THAF38 TaxID=2587856 RepID=UPI0012693B31|nr:hypothetical protein [Microbulbifer sp. THAF38]
MEPPAETTQLYCPKTISIVDKSEKTAPIHGIGDSLIISTVKEILKDKNLFYLSEDSKSDINITIRKAYINRLTTSKSAMVVVSISERETGT